MVAATSITPISRLATTLLLLIQLACLCGMVAVTFTQLYQVPTTEELESYLQKGLFKAAGSLASEYVGNNGNIGHSIPAAALSAVADVLNSPICYIGPLEGGIRVNYGNIIESAIPEAPDGILDGVANSSLCYGVALFAGIGLIFTILCSIVICATCYCCGCGWFDFIAALCGAIYWAAISGIYTSQVVGAQNDDRPYSTWRWWLLGLMWGSFVCFVVITIIRLVDTLRITRNKKKERSTTGFKEVEASRPSGSLHGSSRGISIVSDSSIQPPEQYTNSRSLSRLATYVARSSEFKTDDDDGGEIQTGSIV